MNPEIRDQWASALESGEYKQGKNYLSHVSQEGVSHCCLGVLCQLAVKAGVIPEPKQAPGGFALRYGMAGADIFLPFEVQEWAGIADDNTVHLTVDETLTPAEHLNDILKMSFAEIAALVRAQL